MITGYAALTFIIIMFVLSRFSIHEEIFEENYKGD